MGKHLRDEPAGRLAASGLEQAAADWFFESSLDIFVVLENDAILRVNPTWTRLTGWTSEETLGRPMRDFFHLHDTDVLRGVGHALRAQGAARAE
ncbi:MAG TPA: PAS domain S-box protein, partial [Caulobacter sp.]|nr:PAS domain S-box protein [Caulobacter sp.]